MKAESLSSVLSAFELLLEEVEDEIEYTNQIGSRAFSAGKHDQVKAAMQQVERLTDFRRRVAALRQDWQTLAAANLQDDETAETERAGRRDLGRAARGTRTPEDAFRVPVLQALVDLGGSGTVQEVLDKVEIAMKDRLTPVDYESLPSTPGSPRWRNTAQWCRNTMVNEGLLSDDSPRGTWEITAAGRSFLRLPSRN
jgi:restriction system protein